MAISAEQRRVDNAVLAVADAAEAWAEAHRKMGVLNSPLEYARLEQAVRDAVDEMRAARDAAAGSVISGSRSTSRRAAKLVLPAAQSVRRRLIAAIDERGPMSDVELEELLQVKHSTLSAARHHCVSVLGVLSDSGERHLTDVTVEGVTQTSTHIRWKITATGRRLLDEEGTTT